MEQNGKIIFLGVLLIKTNDTLETTIYRKSTHSGVYLHWNSFAPRTWKHGRLLTILFRICKICSIKELLYDELKQIEKEWYIYPKWVFDQVNEECRLPRNADFDNNIATNNASISTTHTLILPDKGEQEQKIIKSVKNYIKRLLPENHAAKHVYKSGNLGSSFDIKNKKTEI